MFKNTMIASSVTCDQTDAFHGRQSVHTAAKLHISPLYRWRNVTLVWVSVETESSRSRPPPPLLRPRPCHHQGTRLTIQATANCAPSHWLQVTLLACQSRFHVDSQIDLYGVDSLIDPKLSAFQKCHTPFWYIWFGVPTSGRDAL